MGCGSDSYLQPHGDMIMTWEVPLGMIYVRSLSAWYIWGPIFILVYCEVFLGMIHVRSLLFPLWYMLEMSK